MAGRSMAEDLEALAEEVRREHVASRPRRIHVEQSIQRTATAFWRKVARGTPNECWPWEGFRKASGHGLTSHKSLPIHASRKAYILTHGPISSTLCVNHRCDNASCCNPSHLYLGTRADNMIDFWSKTPAAERGRRGRPTVLDGRRLEHLWRMRQKGATLKECAKKFDVHVGTICRYITIARKAKLEKNRMDRLERTKSASI